MPSTDDPKIIVALDYANVKDALGFVDKISPEFCRLKVGKELFTLAGPDLVRQLIQRNFDIFLDLKFHDIPSTVAKACIAAADLGVWMLNVHCLGGRHMMQLAANTLRERGYSTHLIGVTLLTSMDKNTCLEIGLSGDVATEVIRLARLAKDCGLAGVVCSAQEATLLRKECGKDFLLVTPGIRAANANIPQDDQTRVMTPTEALAAGSNYLVIGRMITADPNPLNKLQALFHETQNSTHI